MKKYIDRLNESTEQKNTANNFLSAEESQISLQSEQLRCKKELASLKNQLESLKGCKPLNIKSIYDINNRVSLLERELAFYDNLMKELF